MALTPFNKAPGTQQGRLTPSRSGVSPLEGSFVFALGHDRLGEFDHLNTGDYVEVAQTADFGTSKLLRIKAILRPPTAVPSGQVWILTILIDAAVVTTRRLDARNLTLTDIAVPVDGLVGNHALAMRLTLGT